MKYPPVIVVDEHDNEIGSAMLAEVWAKGLYHRIVSVFVQDETGRLLLQLRAAHVKMFPGCWDPAAGGHVDLGSSYEQAATDELTEEIGVQVAASTLRELGTFRTNTTLEDGRIVNQFERVYLARVPQATEFKLEPDEVRELKWFTPDELRTEIAAHPERFTPGLLEGLRRYFPGFQNES